MIIKYLNKLRHPFCALLLLLCCAQPIVGQIRSGMELGGNIMNADFVLFNPIDTNGSWGIRLGFVSEVPLSNKTYFRGAALINQRGFEFLDERWALNVIDVPLNLGYAIPLANSRIALFLDAGLNVEYNMDAFTKIDGETVRLDIGSSEDDIKRFSQGFNLGTGVRFSRALKLRLNYYQGLTNLVRSADDSWKNRVIGISLNYFFSAAI